MTVLPGANVKLPDVASKASGLPYSYPAFELVFSVSSRSLLGNDESRRDISRALSAIKRINAHVRVEALAADASTVLLSTAITPSVLTLMIAPSELSFASAHHGAPSPAQVAY